MTNPFPIRRTILRVFGLAYIVIALLGFVPGGGAGLLSPNLTYNIFFLVLGFMCLGVADIGSDHAQWFAMMFAFILLVLVIGSFATYFNGTGSVMYWGNTVLNIAAFLGFSFVIYISYKRA
jgi:hypothetical protein